MKFNYKYYEDGPEAMYGLNKNLKAYCCENKVKIILTSCERKSSELIIQKMPNAREDIDIADCFMEFLLFLNTENKEYYTLKKIKGIKFINMTIKKEFINIILSLCAMSDKDYYKDKYIELSSCLIPKEIKLGTLPCKDGELTIYNCIIEDYQSLNGFRGDTLNIFNSTVQQHTGSVTMNCKSISISNTQIDYTYFFLNTILPNIREIYINRDKIFDETSLFFIINFNNLYEITVPAIIEDTYCLDHLRNLTWAYGVWQKDPLSNEKKVYHGERYNILSTKYPEIYVDDEEFSLWNQKIKDINSDDDIRKQLEEAKQNRTKPIKEAYEAQKNRIEPFDIKFLSDIGALRVIKTTLLPFDNYENSITYYILDGLYTTRSKPSKVRYDDGIIPLTRYLDNDSIFVSLEKNRIKTIDTRGNFTIEGSIKGDSVEKVRKTITSINSREKKEISTTFEMKKIKKYSEFIAK